jgi:hypothetical protein
MNVVWKLPAVRAALLLLLVAPGGACVLSGTGEHGYAVKFYEPFDNSRDWGPGYLVGPPRDRRPSEDDHGKSDSDHSVQLAPATHPLPTIPTHSQPDVEQD